jgi:glutathione S-transferase
MLKIYHMPGSRSARVVWAAEELQLPYELIIKQRAQLKAPDYLAVNPLGAAPAIEDGEVVMTESCAIVEYLVDRYDRDNHFAPATSSPARAPYLQWMHFGEASLMAPITGYILATGRFSGQPADEKAMDSAKQRLWDLVGHVDDALARHPYIAGDRFTAADIAVYWNLWIGRRLDAITAGEMTHVDAYAARLEDRPAARKGLAIPEGFVNQPPGSVRTPPRP